MIVRHINENTRIVLSRFYLTALGGAWRLQRRKWYGWKTVSWCYPSVFKIYNRSFDGIIDWLYWNEEQKKNRVSEYEQGLEQIQK